MLYGIKFSALKLFSNKKMIKRALKILRKNLRKGSIKKIEEKKLIRMESELWEKGKILKELVWIKLKENNEIGFIPNY